MKFLKFYEETNQLLENFYDKINLNIDNFKIQDNYLNYLERTFFNCGSNLFIIDSLKEKFDKYHEFLNRPVLTEKEKIDKLKIIKNILKEKPTHKYSIYFDKYFYSHVNSVDQNLKNIIYNLSLYADSNYLKMKYIQNTKTPIIKGTIENLYPELLFIPPFNEKINFNVVLGNIFLKNLIDLPIMLLNKENLISLLSAWYEFYAIKLILLKQIPDINFINSEIYYNMYLNSKIENLRIKKAIENDFKKIELKYSKIKNIENLLKDEFNKRAENIINLYNQKNYNELTKRYSVFSNLLLLKIF